MRRTAYLKAIEEATTLPTKIPNLRDYFKDSYSPRDAALHYIGDEARKDDGLFHGEFIDIYERIREAVR